MTDVLGHACTLTVTNSRNIVPLCECGWIGAVHESHVLLAQMQHARKNAERGARDRATAEHKQHVEAERDAIARAHDAALAAHAAYVEKVRPTLTRVGRWGQG